MDLLKPRSREDAQKVVDGLTDALERRLSASSNGACPVEYASAMVGMCASQSCGKCTPCRVGLPQIHDLIEKVLDGEAGPDALETIEKTAQAVYLSADCAIGFEAGRTALQAVRGFHDDFSSHVEHGRCAYGDGEAIPCVAGCPAGVDIPGYLALAAAGRYADAVSLIRHDNPFALACGLICEHPCELECRRGLIDDAVNIRGMKRFVVEHGGEARLPERFETTGKRVAVVGSGPAGMTAAYYLSLMGHDVTVLERRERLGGMLRYGIPDYRLSDEALDGELSYLIAAGIHIETDVSVGEDVRLADLSAAYDAVYVAIGGHGGRLLGIEGEGAPGVMSAVQMLRDIGDGNPPELEGRRVVVVGGGNVAMDVARSAMRLGATSVTMAYRRRIADMTALDEEIEGARAEGCEILELHAPVKVEVDDEGRVSALIVQPQIIGDSSKGRPVPRDADAEAIALPCDTLIVAIGQSIETERLAGDEVATNRGLLAIDEHCRLEGSENIFAGGDCTSGPKTVILAVAAGKQAAREIDASLGFEHGRLSEIEIPIPDFAGASPCARSQLGERAAGERTCDFSPIEKGFTIEEAHQEASRCLRCDRFGMSTFRGGRSIQW